MPSKGMLFVRIILSHKRFLVERIAFYFSCKRIFYKKN